MAKTNDTGASAPELPQHPFIVPDDPEGTYVRTEAVLAFVQEYTQARALSIEHWDDHPPDEKHLYGMIRVLSGCREAVEYLGLLALSAQGLEVNDE